ncbi:MAG: UDP-N-acetylmuramoyl-L-alanine--D-glutamate ligase, partial [Rhodospirillales bacterium]|nr:UDP-N-acetylmuramoyl-L-alanine--D-glutamate ligase [Rhodospirillales bacterium]
MSGAFPPDLFAGARFAVLGLGRNGLPAATALAAMGAHVTAWDDAAARNAPSPPPSGGAGGVRGTLTFRNPLDARGFPYDALILSPGIPHLLPHPHPVASRARACGVPILSHAEMLFRAVRAAGSAARFVGITGTNVKSTTTALLAHILAGVGVPVAAGGNLGPAALALPLLADRGVYVLEMSSYMLERLETMRFDAAAMLNLSPDHLDRHGDMAGYETAKRAIFARQTDACLAVTGIEDAGSRRLAAWLGTRPARRMTVSGDGSGEVRCVDGVLTDAAGALLAMADAPALPGAHNAQNAAAAAAIAGFLGVGRAAIARGIARFPGLPHRQQKVATIGGVAFVNDSKATNADAAARALGCYPRLVWIAGGQAKAGGIAPLAPFFPAVAFALLIGRDAAALAETLAAAGVPHRIAGTLEAAVPEAFAQARARAAPVVLLSP